jgi:hypothetical protein
VIFAFAADPIDYDYRDIAQQKKIVAETFGGPGLGGPPSARTPRRRHRLLLRRHGPDPYGRLVEGPGHARRRCATDQFDDPHPQLNVRLLPYLPRRGLIGGAPQQVARTVAIKDYETS